MRMLRVNDIDAIRNPERYLYTVASNLVKEYAVLDVGRPAAWTLMIDAHVFVVGTQFDVYRKPDVTTVTVVEGSIAVLAATAAGRDGTSPRCPARQCGVPGAR